MFDTVVEFFQESNTGLCDHLKNLKNDIAYLSDIFTKFNEVNLQLQGDDVNLIEVKSAISFLSKCKLFKLNLSRHELYKIPSLCELDKEKNISDDDFQVYCTHLEELQRDMSERFQILLLVKIPDWVINPFLDVSSEETGEAEEELIAIQNDIELSHKLKKLYQGFWPQKRFRTTIQYYGTRGRYILLPF